MQYKQLLQEANKSKDDKSKELAKQIEENKEKGKPINTLVNKLKDRILILTK